MAEVVLGAEAGSDREAEVAERLPAFRCHGREEGPERPGPQDLGEGIRMRRGGVFSVSLQLLDDSGMLEFTKSGRASRRSTHSLACYSLALLSMYSHHAS